MNRFEVMEKEITEDIELARKAIVNASLCDTQVFGSMACEFYRLPAHNRKTYYGMIYQQNQEWFMLYAFPEIYRAGVKITMYTFAETLQANHHGASRGHIVCGRRKVHASTVERILDLLRTNEKGTVFIDSNYTLDAEMYFYRTEEKEVLFRNCGMPDENRLSNETLRELIDEMCDT